MQKIMFNDKYGLTDLVLSGKKTQTRRVVKEQYRYPNKEVYWDANHKALCFRGKTTVDYIAIPRYYVGEGVAVAQSYQKAGVVFVPIRESDFINKRSVKWGNARKLAGWKNKLFARAELMLHAIKITNIRVERLQDISDEDCLKEGVLKGEFRNTWDKYYLYYGEVIKTFKTPHHAFTTLIDKINGKGTCDSNPYVWVYDFELVK